MFICALGKVPVIITPVCFTCDSETTMNQETVTSFDDCKDSNILTRWPWSYTSTQSVFWNHLKEGLQLVRNLNLFFPLSDSKSFSPAETASPCSGTGPQQAHGSSKARRSAGIGANAGKLSEPFFKVYCMVFGVFPNIIINVTGIKQ